MLSNFIICGDCLLVLPTIADASIDMILCDLPYSVTAAKWDVAIDLDALWLQYKRIIKFNGSILLFAAQPFTTQLICSNKADFRYCWYWIKNQATNFFHARHMPLRRIEEICVFRGAIYNPQMLENQVPTNSARGSSRGNVYYGTNNRDYAGGNTVRFPSNILEFKCVNNYARVHPTQKPVELCRYLIRTYTEPDALVLDNCLGSGTTALAAILENRRYIGIEQDAAYVKIAHNRIAEISGHATC